MPTLPTINPQTLAELLQVGGQYIIPVAALLRALYSGVRGKLPEGFAQIATAAAVAGVSAGVSGQQPNWQTILNDVLSNTVFTAGVLAFIVVYLLRMPNAGLVVDGLVGAVIGAVVWLFTVYVLGEPWPWWMLALLIPACAVGFIALRFALRQIIRVVRIAVFLLVVAGIIIVGAGGIMLLQTVLAQVKV
jgi:hypothetical protein